MSASGLLRIKTRKPALTRFDASPDGEQIEIKSNSLFVVAELLHKMSQP